MADETLLTVEEASKLLKISKYTIYELAKRGELPFRRIGRQLRFERGALQRYLQGDNRQAPAVENSGIANQKPSPNILRFIGSHEPSLELLIDFLKHSSSGVSLLPSFRGSMEGLIALYRRKADIAGAHLWDEQTGEYNLPFIRHVLPGEAPAVINLVQRVQGWIVQPGNPFKLETMEDISKEGLRFVNRQKGSGTRLRLDSFLRKKGIAPASIKGYELEENTHIGVACRVANGEADAGIAVKAAAERLGLDFVPLFSERYDLICLQEASETKQWQSLVSALRSEQFKHAVNSCSGYDTSLTGKYMN